MSASPAAVIVVEEHLSAKELAERLSLTVATLARWRCEGGGPAYHKVTGRVIYAASDVNAWLKRNRRLSTTDVPSSQAGNEVSR